MREGKEEGRHRQLYIALGIILIVVLAFAAFEEFYVIPRTNLAELHPKVTVSGVVKTLTPGTTATSIDFAPQSGNVTSGQVVTTAYVVFLNNIQNYTVTIHWQSSTGLTGSCQAGTYHLKVNGDTTSANFQC